MVHSMRGKMECQWFAVDSIGKSGGNLTIWRKELFSPVFSFRGNRFSSFNVYWKGMNCYLVNVCASCSIADKRIIWSELIEWKGKCPAGEWMVGGDLNAIKLEEEMSGRGWSCCVKMDEFASFIDIMELTDLPCMGNKFTRFNSNGSCKSHLGHYGTTSTR